MNVLKFAQLNIIIFGNILIPKEGEKNGKSNRTY